MADRALLKVTQVALGIPEATGTMDIDRQADLITKKLDIEDLKEPAKLDKFLERFAALWEIENPTTAPSNGIVQLIDGSSNVIGMDLLQQIQNVRNGVSHGNRASMFPSRASSRCSGASIPSPTTSPTARHLDFAQRTSLSRASSRRPRRRRLPTRARRSHVLAAQRPDRAHQQSAGRCG